MSLAAHLSRSFRIIVFPTAPKNGLAVIFWQFVLCIYGFYVPCGQNYDHLVGGIYCQKGVINYQI